MEIIEKDKEGLSRSYVIALKSEEIEAKIEEGLRERQRSVQMKGFRRGKVPVSVIRRMLGEDFEQSTLQDMITAVINTRLQEKGHRTVDNPSVDYEGGLFPSMKDILTEDKGLELTVRYDIFPEMPDINFGNISLKRMVVGVTDQMVDEAMANFAAQEKDYKKRRKGSKARLDDQVVLDAVGMVDGVAFEGGTITDHELVLGSGSFIPGFEDQLVGQKVDEEPFDVNVTFPSDYHVSSLAGKDAVFSCTIKEIQEPIALEIDEDYAQKKNFKSLEDWKTQVRSQLEVDFESVTHSHLQRTFLLELSSQLDFEIPESLLRKEYEVVKKEDAESKAESKDDSESEENWHTHLRSSIRHSESHPCAQDIDPPSLDARLFRNSLCPP
jgi:trigger factor